MMTPVLLIYKFNIIRCVRVSPVTLRVFLVADLVENQANVVVTTATRIVIWANVSRRTRPVNRFAKKSAAPVITFVEPIATKDLVRVFHAKKRYLINLFKTLVKRFIKKVLRVQGNYFKLINLNKISTKYCIC